jgi:hypothetical protein
MELIHHIANATFSRDFNNRFNRSFSLENFSVIKKTSGFLKSSRVARPVKEKMSGRGNVSG